MSAPRRVVDHPVLGSLAHDPLMICWQTRSAVPLGDADHVTVAVLVSSEEDIPVERLDKAAAILGRLDPRLLRGAVAEDYLELYNDTWRQDDDPELDQDGFVARIAPTSVELDDDGVRIYFGDGDLFAGHSLVVTLNPALEITDITLSG
jgi:hypothetical protein